MIASRHSRLLRALQAKSRPSPLRHVTKIPSRQLLYLPHSCPEQSRGVQNRDARNSFGFRSYAKYRVTSFKPNIFLSPRASRSSDVSRKSLRHNLLSDPHPLNLYPTIFYKNMPGRGYSRCSGVETFQRADNLDPHKSFSCNTYRSPSKCCKQKTYGSARSQLSPVAATLTKNTGGYLSQAKSLSLSAGQSVLYLVTSLLHYFARRSLPGRMDGQRAKM